MTDDAYSRTRRLIGEEALKKLRSSRVAVFGIGGVGGYVTEALARTGIGTLDLIDSDEVVPSNLNRQIVALHSTLGMKKVDAARARIADIDPTVAVHTYPIFFLPETADTFDFSAYDYVVDAIDTVSGKMELVRRCRAAGTPIICSMGAGDKLDPTAFEIADIYKTEVCPLAKVMRSLCRKEGIPHLKVAYSKEPRIEPLAGETPEESHGKRAPASAIFVPAAAGLAIAAEVVKDLIAGIDRPTPKATQGGN